MLAALAAAVAFSFAAELEPSLAGRAGVDGPLVSTATAPAALAEDVRLRQPAGFYALATNASKPGRRFGDPSRLTWRYHAPDSTIVLTAAIVPEEALAPACESGRGGGRYACEETRSAPDLSAFVEGAAAPTPRRVDVLYVDRRLEHPKAPRLLRLSLSYLRGDEPIRSSEAGGYARRTGERALARLAGGVRVDPPPGPR